MHANKASGTTCPWPLQALLYLVLVAGLLLVAATGAWSPNLTTSSYADSVATAQPAAVQHSASKSTTRSSSINSSTHQPFAECPAWFTQYEVFHAAARGKPGTRYLIHQVPAHSTGKSGGFGDRLRGMLFALRLAAATKRVLLFTWARPVELHHLLVPAGAIDWTTDGVPGYNTTQQQQQKAALVLRFMNGAHHPLVLSGELSNSTEQFVIVQTNQRMDAPCKGCPALPEMDPSTACVWSRLFKPTADILTQADQELQRLYGSRVPKYVAAHLRLGGFTGEAEHERGKGPLKNFAAAVRCANQLAAQHGVNSSAPVLMVTDNEHLRTFLSPGHLPHVVAPSTQPVHIDQTLHLDNNVTAHRSTVVDMVLLSRGACLVTSPGYRHDGLSGFSHHAWLLGGGRPCHIDFRKCL